MAESDSSAESDFSGTPALWTSASADTQRPEAGPTPEHTPASNTLPSATAASAMPPAYCRACGQPLDPRAVMCPKCGVPQAPTGDPNGGRAETKSAGLAIFLSFLWPGVGHLYAGGDTEKGIIFTCISCVCFLISWTIIGLVLTVPVWFGTAVYTMIDSNRLVQQRNRSLDVPTRQTHARA